MQNSSKKYVDVNGNLKDTAEYISVKGGSEVTIPNLAPGTYTVKEQREVAGIAGYSLEVAGEGDVVVTAGTEPVVKTITNTYEKPPVPETTPTETTPAETTVPETTPAETTTPSGGNGGPSEEVETDEYGRVRGANRGKNKNGQDGGNVKGANRGKTRTGDESRMSIFGFGFLAAVLVLLGWFGIRFTKRNRR